MQHGCGKFIVGCLLIVLLQTAATAEPPAPPSNVVAVDHPNDVGKSIDITWDFSPDDLPAGLGRNAACFGVTVAALLIFAFLINFFYLQGDVRF